MARFYKATSPQFIDDKMFDMPVELMTKAIDKTDKDIDDIYDTQQTIADSLQVENLDTDDPAVRERIKYYSDIVNKSAKAMDEDILNFRKQGSATRKASRELSSDLKSGIFSKAKEQLTKNKEIEADLKGRQDLKQSLKDRANEARLKGYSEAGGLAYDYETGTHNNIGDFQKDFIPQIVDMNKYMKELGDTVEWQVTKSGGGDYEATLRDGTKVIKGANGEISEKSKERITTHVKSNLDMDKYYESQLQEYELFSDEELGVDAEGNKITPEQLAQQDYDKALAMGVNALVGSKGSISSTIKGSPGNGNNTGNPFAIGTEYVAQDETIPSGDIAERNKINKKLDTYFAFDNQKYANMTPEQIATDLGITTDEVKILAAGNLALRSAGFTSVNQMYEKSSAGYSPSTMNNLGNTLYAIGAIDGATAAQRADQTAAWMTAQDAKLRAEKDVHSSDPTHTKSDQTLYQNKSIELFNNLDISQPVDKIYVEVNGKSVEVTNVNSLKDLTLGAGMEVTIPVPNGNGGTTNERVTVTYLPATSSTEQSVKRVGSDATGWISSDTGVSIKDPATGKPMSYEKLKLENRLHEVKTVYGAGTASYDYTDNVFQANSKDRNFRQVEKKSYNTMGGVEKTKQYIYDSAYYMRIDDGDPSTPDEVRLVKMKAYFPSDIINVEIKK